MTDNVQWWYEKDGQQAGPVAAEALAELIRTGEVRTTARVWRAGMAGWQPVAQIPELASQAAPPSLAPPALDVPPAAAPAPMATQAVGPAGPASGPGWGGAAQAGFGGGQGIPAPAHRPGPSPSPWAPPAAQPAPGAEQEIPIGTLVLLSIVTFGIYGVIKFYQTGVAYERLAGRQTRFALFFWLYVGLTIFGTAVNMMTGLLGLPFSLAGVVFGVLTLFEALTARDEGLRRHQLSLPVTPDSTHKILYILGSVLAFVLVGVVLIIIQAVKWFEDWNLIVRGMQARR